MQGLREELSCLGPYPQAWESGSRYSRGWEGQALPVAFVVGNPVRKAQGDGMLLGWENLDLEGRFCLLNLGRDLS